jgi:uncharacterized protein (DUF58 family)
MSLGGRMFYLSAVFGVLMLLFSLLTVCIAKRCIRFRCELLSQSVLRGEYIHAQLTAECGVILPISPVLVLLCCGGKTYAVQFERLTKQNQTQNISIPAPHVGVPEIGVDTWIFSDIFGLFEIRMRGGETGECLVLPRDFEVQALRFLSSDDGRALPNRTSEDLSSPDDTRAYRPGDPLKRVHWKLSARRRELTVRRYETPAPPDTLILMDCTLPGSPADSEENRAVLRDTLCETALSVALMQSRSDAPVRMPFYGEQTAEFYMGEGHTQSISMLPELLARQPFSGGADFARVLNLELRRMRRTGATVIITSRLSADVVEGIAHIRRMGPSARVYLITKTPDAPQDRPYVARLQQCMVEVCYVSPA